MGQMVKVMGRISVFYDQYADGLITDAQCLLLMQQVCIEEMAGIINQAQQEIIHLKRDIQEGSDLLEVVVGGSISDTIPAPASDNYFPPILIPHVVVGDECAGPFVSAHDCPIHNPGREATE